MNSKQMFIRWLATEFPQVHIAALRMIQPGLRATGLGFMPPGGGRLSALGDDPVASTLDSLDLSITGGYTTPNLSPVSPIDTTFSTSLPSYSVIGSQPPPASTSSAAADWTAFAGAVNSLTQAGTGIANAINTNQATQSLIAINTQRAQMGLPPLSSVTGQPVTAAGLMGASPTLAQIEANLSGTGGMLPLLLIGGVLVAIFMSRRSGSAPA